MIKLDNEKSYSEKQEKIKYIFPNERISLNKELEIIKGLVVFSDKGSRSVNYKDIKIGTYHAEISRELTFLDSIGLAQSEKRGEYLPTEICIEFINRFEWDQEDAKNYLNQLILETWFGKLTKNYLTVKKIIEKEDLFKELGKNAKADREKDKKKIYRLIEWMRWVNLIEEEDNKISFSSKKISKTVKKMINIKPPISKKIEKLNTLEGLDMLQIKLNEKTGLLNNLKFIINITPELNQDDIKQMIKNLIAVLKEFNNETI